MPLVYLKLLLLYIHIYHLMKNLGIVSLYLCKFCLAVAGTQDPLTLCLVRLPFTVSPNAISVINHN
jgi:hypothetical protein